MTPEWGLSLVSRSFLPEMVHLGHLVRISIISVGSFPPGMIYLRPLALGFPLNHQGVFFSGSSFCIPVLGVSIIFDRRFFFEDDRFVPWLGFSVNSVVFFPSGMGRLCPLVGGSINLVGIFSLGWFIMTPWRRGFPCGGFSQSR